MQNKYYKTGKFTVFLSYVQTFNNTAGDYLKKNAPTVPVYNQVRLKHAPCGRGIPHAVLFDHKGKVVGTGSASKLITQIPDLVKATPDPPSPILGGVEVKYCKSQAKQLADGKSIASTLKYLKLYAAKDDDRAKEAKALIEAVNNYVEKEKERLIKSSETAPAKTLLQIKPFALQIRMMECEKEIKALYTKLKSDRYINILSNTMNQVKKTQDKIAKKGTAGKSEIKALEKSKASLKKMIDSPNTPEAVKNEAKEFMDSF